MTPFDRSSIVKYIDDTNREHTSLVISNRQSDDHGHLLCSFWEDFDRSFRHEPLAHPSQGPQKSL